MRQLRSVIGVGASACSLALVGCSGSSNQATESAPAKNVSQTTTVASRTTPAVTITRRKAGQAYLAAVAPTNAAGAALAGKMRAYTDSTSGSRISAVAGPFERRLTELNGKLLGIASAYPPAAADLKALITAYNPVIHDLRSTSGQNSLNGSSWLRRLASDLTKTRGAAAIVRSDLGLSVANP
jgi:hypothetical protein